MVIGSINRCLWSTATRDRVVVLITRSVTSEQPWCLRLLLSRTCSGLPHRRHQTAMSTLKRHENRKTDYTSWFAVTANPTSKIGTLSAGTRVQQILPFYNTTMHYSGKSGTCLFTRINPSSPTLFLMLAKWVYPYQSVQRHTGLTHPFYFLTFGHAGTQDWAPECPNVKKLKRWIRPVWPWTLWSVTIWHHWAWKG